MNRITNLVNIKPKVKGRVISLSGGRKFCEKLMAMGICTGAVISKVSSPFMKGPVIAKIGNTQIAIGYGMAGKIQLEVEEE